MDDTRIRSVSGAAIRVKRRISLNFVIDSIKFNKDFLVTENVPNNHIILNAKRIIANKNCMPRLLNNNYNDKQGIV